MNAYKTQNKFIAIADGCLLVSVTLMMVFAMGSLAFTPAPTAKASTQAEISRGQTQEQRTANGANPSVDRAVKS